MKKIFALTFALIVTAPICAEGTPIDSLDSNASVFAIIQCPRMPGSQFIANGWIAAGTQKKLSLRIQLNGSDARQNLITRNFRIMKFDDEAEDTRSKMFVTVLMPQLGDVYFEFPLGNGVHTVSEVGLPISPSGQNLYTSNSCRIYNLSNESILNTYTLHESEIRALWESLSSTDESVTLGEATAEWVTLDSWNSLH